jgi:alpha-1,3-glucosyltransferase
MSVVAVLVCVGVVLRLLVGSHSYSGQGKPPMFGDYEAQRHWMEITVNLPVQQWYINSTQNDLLYWGIDYPPLSAHWAWFLGRIALQLQPELVALHESRGLESEHSKLFMRVSVLFADLFVFFSAAIALSSHISKNQAGLNRMIILAYVLLHPCFILVDHGHFQ